MESGIIFRISRLFPTQGFDRLSTSCDMPHASALTGFQVVLASEQCICFYNIPCLRTVVSKLKIRYYSLSTLVSRQNWSSLNRKTPEVNYPMDMYIYIHPCTIYMIHILLPGGLPIALFPDGEDLSASGSGTPSEDDEVEGGDDLDDSNGSWEDIEVEEDV